MLSNWWEVFPSEEVHFECRVYDSSDWTFIWYRNGQPVDDADSNVSLNSSHAQAFLTITAESQLYSGTYSCKAYHKTKGISTESNPIQLKVYANKPEPTLGLDPKLEQMFPGEYVTYQCMINVSSGWEYLWFHDNNEIKESHNNTHDIVSLALSHNGKYSCQAKRGGRPFYTERSRTLTLRVSEPPTPILKLQTSWSDVFPKENVKMTCNTGSPNWNFTWYRNGKPLQDDREIMTLGSSLLNITSVSRHHQGEYACKAHLDSRKVSSALSNTINLTIYENIPKPSLRKDPVWISMFVGENITWRCNVQVGSDWVYHWFKDKKDLVGTNETLRIQLRSHDAGTYWCKATRGQSTSTKISEQLIQNVQEIPLPSLWLNSLWPDVFPTESVTLRCAMADNSGWTYTWRRDNQAIAGDDTISIGPDGATLSIGSASLSHRGLYSCMGKLNSRSVISNFTSGLKVNVYEKIPTPSLSKDPVWNPMFVGENATFTCKVPVGSDWVYHWFKDQNKLESTNETLRIHLGSHDAGTYWCKATRGQNTSTDISNQLIQNILEIPLPSLMLNGLWTDVFPTESVTLSCAIATSSGWTYTWRRDNQAIAADNTISIGSDGATLSIGSMSPYHRGEYSCSGELKGRSVRTNFTSGLKLTVYDNKPTIKLEQEPEHMVLHTGDTVSYSCHINVSFGWEYMWFKDDTQLSESGKNYKISSVVKTNTGSYKCQAVRRQTTTIFKTEQSQPLKLQVEERPSANINVLTGWSEVFATDSLELKCEVEGNETKWNYTWLMEGQVILNTSSNRYTVTPQNDPKQSDYVCQGIRPGRPSYSKRSDALATKNLVLKRRVLLSISGCILFGIAAVFFGCFLLRIIKKPVEDDGGPEEGELFLTMAQLKDRDDAPCPLVDYITNVDLDHLKKGEADIICSESNAVPVTLQEDQVVTTESSDRTPDEEGALVSFQR
ncbi:hemicentin-1 [Stigmatopora nigra]